ncbi:glycosyltransferase family 2 protein [Paracoccus ravus]|uniref:glycosyltransferase family 2 protein n=1 Tax=Paracoccus ravus TaxID=2447760 RepID=UPI001FD66ED6|nr:glycosyltransferase family 2 protein [Paracoccus ravus]
MATRNGACFLPDQLQSICNQKLRDWKLFVSDDCSLDATYEIISEYSRRLPQGQVELLQGPGQGAAANFMSLIRRAPEAEYYAFSDQDDVWLPEKLSHATEALARVPKDRPALYCARVTVCDASLRELHLTPPPTSRPGFRNALIQNIAHGNTIVFNQAAHEILRPAAARLPQVVMHDWWAYLVISGAGGEVIFDDRSDVLYRQHSGNVVGEARGLERQLRKVQAMFSNRHSEWLTINLQAMSEILDMLDDENRSLVELLVEARSSSQVLFSLVCLREHIHRQGRFGRLIPPVSAMLGVI